MPNLIPSMDTSDVYSEDITLHYTFKDIKISNPNFQLKYATGKFNGNASHFYLLTDNDDKHLAVIRLVETIISGRVYHKISKSFAIIQRKGYGEVLYENCIKKHQTAILSDSLNTLPGSFNLWKKLIQRNTISVFRFDINNNRRSKIKLPLDEFLIWGVDYSFLEAIKSTPWSAVNFTDDSLEIDDDSDEAEFVNYLTENDVIQRTILSDFIVKALQSKRRVKNRDGILLLVKKQLLT